MTKDDFIGIVRDELDLPLESEDIDRDFDQVVTWDSMHLLRLIAALETETGTRLKIGQLMSDRSLSAIYERVAS
jgi:acyl carrier protein